MKSYIFNIDKPAGWTSFDVVNKIRRITNLPKVGHAGTLDPFATGVLIVLGGAATRRFSEFAAYPKEYQARIQLGIKTRTGDLTGEIIDERPVPQIDEGHIRAVLHRFEGIIEQVPPMFSAKKYQGRPLYVLARKGVNIPRQPVKVEIKKIDLLHWSPEEGQLEIKVFCGKGTYIRVLAEDIGEVLGCGAHLLALQRLAVGPYRLEDAWKIEEFEHKWTSSAA